MNNFLKWVALLKKNGLLCDMYSEKVDNAKSKLELVRCCLDANGANFLQEMQSEGHELPYEIIHKLFRAYINGRYTAEFKNENNRGYTSCMYCCWQDDIYVETTLVTVLNCDCNIYIGSNSVVRIYLDKNCKVRIFCPQSSFCMVDYWGDAVVDTTHCDSKVEVTKKD